MKTTFVCMVGKCVMTMPLRRHRHVWKVTVAFDDKEMHTEASGSLRMGFCSGLS